MPVDIITRPPKSTDLQQIRQVRNLARRNLPIVHSQGNEAIDRHKVERRAHKPDTRFIAQRFKLRA